MRAVFLRRSEPVAVIRVEDRRKVTSKWYNEVSLPQAFGELNSDRYLHR